MRQLKNHVTLAAPSADAAQVFITECTRSGVCNTMVWGGVYTGGNISADWNKRWQNGQYEGHCHVLLFVCFNWKWREIENCKIKKGIKVHVKFVLPVLHDEYSTMFCRKQNKLNFFFPLFLFCTGWDSDQPGRFITFWWDLYSVVQPVTLQAESWQKTQGTQWWVHVSVKQAIPVTGLTGLGEWHVGYYCASKKNARESNCVIAL